MFSVGEAAGLPGRTRAAVHLQLLARCPLSPSSLSKFHEWAFKRSSNSKFRVDSAFPSIVTFSHDSCPLPPRAQF
jgi:hypothetical protein